MPTLHAAFLTLGAEFGAEVRREGQVVGIVRRWGMFRMTSRALFTCERAITIRLRADSLARITVGPALTGIDTPQTTLSIGATVPASLMLMSYTIFLETLFL